MRVKSNEVSAGRLHTCGEINLAVLLARRETSDAAPPVMYTRGEHIRQNAILFWLARVYVLIIARGALNTSRVALYSDPGQLTRVEIVNTDLAISRGSRGRRRGGTELGLGV